MMLNENWYAFEQADQLDSPALIVYPERVKKNTAVLKSLVDDVFKLRPHIKTSKAKQAVLLLLEAGIQKFKCATIAEAEMLAQCEAPDVLLAYQPVRPKAVRLIALLKNYPKTRFSCLVDNLSSATLLSDLAAAQGLTIPVYIDLNVGMNRTGIKPGEQLIELFEALQAMPHVQLLGLHAYDGHIREVDFEKRAEECNESFKIVEQIREALEQKGYGYPLLIAGGSPTFQIHSNRRNVEVSPGTFVFWDKGYSDNIPEQPFLCAALVLTRVISLPAEGKICIDLGYKAIASENDIRKRVFFINAPHLIPVSHSEEHMILDAGENHSFKVGDLLYAIPYHVCPTVALYSNAVAIESGQLSGTWKIDARNRKIQY